MNKDTKSVKTEIAENGWMIKEENSYSDLSKRIESELPVALVYIAKAITKEFDSAMALEISHYFSTEALKLVKEDKKAIVEEREEASDLM